MELEKIIQAVKEELPEQRFDHTKRVVATALELAETFGGNKEKIKIAGYLHDYCKFWSKDRLIEWIKTYQLPQDLLSYNQELWHAPVGAEVARVKFGIEDEDILQAIRFHTSGRPEMSLLEKLIFLADYIEPGRKFPGVEVTRQYAKESLDRAILQALDQTIQFLLTKGQKIYPMTLYTRNAFLEKLHHNSYKGGV